MGGLGSGRRRSSTVASVEDVPALDVGLLAGDLNPAELRAAECTFPDGTRIIAWVTWEGARFGYRRPESPGSPITYVVAIDRHASGVRAGRPYWRCPALVDGLRCHKAVTKLYWCNGYFICRQCARLSYASQHQPAFERAMGRVCRLRAKLGATTADLAPFAYPPRPPCMRERTYQRTLRQLNRAELAADTHFCRRAGALRGDARGKRRKS
jgi:hypothetical protein